MDSARRQEFDHVVICGAGDLGEMAGALADVQGVRTVAVCDDRIHVVVPHGEGVTPRLIEIAELSGQDPVALIVVPEPFDARWVEVLHFWASSALGPDPWGSSALTPSRSATHVLLS